MMRLARERSRQYAHSKYQAADAVLWEFPVDHFDCIVSIVTLHHLPLEAMLTNMKDALRVNGVLLILDLYEESLAGTFTTLAALPAAVGTSNGFRPACVRCACSLPLKGNRFRILRKHLRGSQEERDRGPLLLPRCWM